MKNNGVTEYFDDIELIKEYDGYYYSVSEAITIVILGSICGLKNTRQIHQWAENDRTREFLKENFSIERIPSYYWLLCLLKLIKPDSLNRSFMNWAYSFVPKNAEKLTIALDGKTIRSTVQMDSYENPMHIISAQLSELGITLAQRSVDGKSNEIPAVQKLLEELNIKGTMVVADALNCQKDTAEIVVDGKADYLFCVKGNHPNLKKIYQIISKMNGKKESATLQQAKKTEEESKLERLMLQLILHGWSSERNGRVYAVSEQYTVKLKQKKERPKSGIIIFQAAN